MTEPNLVTKWRVHELGMAERGSGLTKEQMIGAIVALTWVETVVREIIDEAVLDERLKWQSKQ